MKVVHVGEYVSGGVATYLRVLIDEQIHDDKISQIILFMSDKNSEQLSFESPKVKIVRYEYERNVSGILKLMTLWKEIKNQNPDVVHLHSTFAGLLRVRNLFTSSKFRVIYCSHGWAFARDSSESKNRVFAGVERLLAHGCDSIINISPAEQKRALSYKLPEAKMLTINNSIQLPDELPQKQSVAGPLQVLFVGRFDRQKGVDILLEAAKRLGDIEFRLAGRSVVGGFKLNNQTVPANVNLLGWLSTDQVAREMQNSDAVIIPSRWEGFGLVALEAMKNQCAVLATNVGGLANVVDSETFGRKFEPNSVDAIVQTLQSLNRDQLRLMGENAQKTLVNKYDSKAMEQQVMDVYTK